MISENAKFVVNGKVLIDSLHIGFSKTKITVSQVIPSKASLVPCLECIWIKVVSGCIALDFRLYFLRPNIAFKIG